MTLYTANVSQVLELACTREADKVFDAGGLSAIMSLLINHSEVMHGDSMRSCMSIVTRLISRMEPKDGSLESCVNSLSSLLQHRDPQISGPAMRCFMTLADRFIRRGKDPAPIANKGLVQELVSKLASIGQPVAVAQGGATPEKPTGHAVTTIVNLLSTLCRGSPTITHVRLYCSIHSIFIALI